MDKWDHRFMEVARLVATWASCYQADRKIGAVIVQEQAHHDHRLQRRARGRKNLRGAGRMHAQKAAASQSGTRHELLLRHPRGAERHHSGGEAGRVH